MKTRWLHILCCLLLCCGFSFAADVRLTDSLPHESIALPGLTVHNGGVAADAFFGWGHDANDELIACRSRQQAHSQNVQSRPQLSGYLQEPCPELLSGAGSLSASFQTANIYFGSFLKCLLFPKHFFW